MKIIRVIATSPALKLDFHPDSALVLQGRPLFMPEEGDGWQAEIFLAVKIGRLGKNIAPKFAARYYDGLTAAMRLVLPADPEMESVIAGMDSGIAHGEWLDPSIASAPLTVSVGSVAAHLAPVSVTIDEAISLISRYTTLKMGDIILLPASELCLPLEAPGRFDMQIDGRLVLSLKLV